MKLNKLQVKNFLGLPDADIDLSSPVSVFLGTNAQGKSSVRDAITFGLCGTVPNRGFNRKNQAPQLACRAGDGTLSVTLETPESVIARTEKKGTKVTIDPETAMLAINPQDVLGMDAKNRQRVFGALLSHSSQADKIEEYLSKMNGFGTEVYDKCRDNLDTAQDWAIEQRQQYGRLIKELNTKKMSAPSSVVDIGEGDNARTFDLTKLTMSDIDDKIRLRQNERDSYMKELGTLPDNPPATDGLLEQKKAIEKFIVKQEKALEENKRDIANLKDLIKTQQKQAQELYKKGAEAHGHMKRLEADLKKWEDMGDFCPHCNSEIATEKKNNLIDAVKQQVTLCKKDFNSYDKAVATLDNKMETKHGELKSAEEIQETYKKAIKDSKEDVKSFDDMFHAGARIPVLTADLNEVNQMIAFNEKLRLEKSRFDAVISEKKSIEASIENYDKKSAEMDRLDKLLKPDGDLRRIANEALATIPFDEVLLKVWDMEGLMLSSEGEITYLGSPIESASDSEKYRAGVLLSELLSRNLGIGILVLDGIEILDSFYKTHLFQRLPAWSSNFDNIILISTVLDKPTNILDEAWLKYYWVDNGKVEPLTS